MITIDEIRKNLIDAIKQSNLTQTEIAKRLGIKQQAVAQYLSGRAMPALDTFANLCAELDIDPAEMFSLQSSNYYPVGTVKNFYEFIVYESITKEGDNLTFNPTGKEIALSQKQLRNFTPSIQLFNWKKINDYFFALSVSDNTMYPHYRKGDVVFCQKTGNIDYIKEKRVWIQKQNRVAANDYDGIIFNNCDKANICHINYEYPEAPDIIISHYDIEYGNNETTFKKNERRVNISDCTFIGRVLMTIRTN